MGEIGGNMVEVRVMGDPVGLDGFMGRIVDALEKEGHEVIRWTPVYPCREPQKHLSRVYLTVVKKGD